MNFFVRRPREESYLERLVLLFEEFTELRRDGFDSIELVVGVYEELLYGLGEFGVS